MPGSWRLLSHTADTGVEAEGATLGEMAASAVQGLVGSMFAPTPDVSGGAPMEAWVPGGDLPEVLVELLAEVLFRFEVDDVLPVEPTVEIDDDGGMHLRATAVPSSEFDVAGPPVKAITYHELTVEHRPDGWYARVIFDV
ncbi:MAG: archease [Acidimicrobiia bacterium]